MTHLYLRTALIEAALIVALYFIACSAVGWAVLGV